MRNILFFCICYALLPTVGFAYTPSTELDNKIDATLLQIEAIIDEKWEWYRDNFISAIEYYSDVYSSDEKSMYILWYMLEALELTPNILLIIADDMWLDATPWYEQGSIKPSMPYLESMIDSWIRYTNLWSAPVCTPTRATIMTGKYGYHTNMLKVDDTLDTWELGLQEFIDEETNKSYDHAVIWKWHIWNQSWHPEATGVWYYAGMQSWWVKSYYDWRLVEDAATTNSSEYVTSKFTDLAIDWMSEREKPWFLWLAYTAPHTPFHLPPSDLHSQWNLPDDEESIASNSAPYYMAALEAMDSEIGRLLSYIPEDEREKTTIIFIGDNGTPGKVSQRPYWRKQAKWSLYQWGINVPMVVSWYGVERNGEIDERLINTSDLYATIADIAGIDIESIHNSYSFTETFYQSETEDREYIYSELWGKGHTVRGERYKLIVLDTGNSELYDLQEDPYESDDMFSDGISSAEESILEDLEAYIAEARE